MAMEEDTKTIVLYPSMGAGHLAPMLQLAKRFAELSFSVAIVTTDSPHKTGAGAATSADPLISSPLISFHALPPVSVAPAKQGHPFVAMYDTIRAYNPKLLAYLTSLSTAATVRALVIDFFRTDAIDVARQLSIPVYVLFSSGASVFALGIHLPFFHASNPNQKSFEDLGDDMINFPGLPPIPVSDLPKPMLDRDSEILERRIRNYKRYLEADGILINSFESLEPKAVKALKEGTCVPGHKMPPVYCIGPLVQDFQQKENQDRHECLTWLDSQPKCSVVFLCFGSAGAFTAEQIEEIAVGLENCGQRFLWVVCWKNNPKDFLEPRPEPDLDSFLPEGFIDRTENRGMVLKSWAPQLEVLNHESVGGFVSHCGWNSTLEAILAGVPLICWPLYAEQSLNKVLLVEEIKIGVVMEGYNKELVRAEEVEVKVRWLMESEGGRKLRERMVAVKEKAVQALAEGGPSAEAFATFFRDL